MAGIGPRLDQRQGTSIVLTPQMRQSIDLLQKPIQELNSMVRAEMEENPFLSGEAPDSNEEPSGEGDANPAGNDSSAGNENEAYYEGEGNYTVDEFGSDQVLEDHAQNFTTFERLDAGHDNIYEADYTGKSSGGQANDTEEDFDVFSRISSKKQLRQVLEEQIDLMFDLDHQQQLARLLIDHLDPRGYFIGDTQEIAAELGTEETTLNGLIERLQSLEPTGVFARSLQECIALQLKERDRYDPAMALFVDNLELLADGEIEKLIALCGVLPDDIDEMIDEIRKVDVSPASTYEFSTVPVTVPDVIVRQGDKPDEWIIELTNQPRLQLNRQLYDQFVFHTKHFAQEPEASKDQSDAGSSAQTEAPHAAETPAAAETAAASPADDADDAPEDFDTAERYKRADFLISAIEHRGVSIVRVTEKILEWQKEFFQYGISHMRPMVLRDIAVELDMHESTVSRICSKKYLQTPRGVFEMRFFFSRGIKNASGQTTISSRTVKDRISALISTEPREKPLSDGAMVILLGKEGISLARRTVTKYREELNISSSLNRKRQYKRPYMRT